MNYDWISKTKPKDYNILPSCRPIRSGRVSVRVCPPSSISLGLLRLRLRLRRFSLIVAPVIHAADDIKLQLGLRLDRVLDRLGDAVLPLHDDEPLELTGRDREVLQRVDEQVRDLGVRAQLVEELERLQLGGQARRVEPRLLGRLTEELVVPVDAERLEVVELAEGERPMRHERGEVDGDRLERVARRLDGDHVVADAVGALLELRGRLLVLGHDELFERLGEHEEVGEGVVVDVALDEVELAERRLVGLLDEVEAAVVELRPLNDKRLEGGVGEDVDVFVQVPVLVVLGLVEERARLEAGQVKGPVKQHAHAVEQRVGHGHIERLQVGHGGYGPGQAVEGQGGVILVHLRAMDGRAGD